MNSKAPSKRVKAAASITKNHTDLNVRTGMQAAALKQAVTDHLRYSVGRLEAAATSHDYYRALALAVRDRMQQRWMNTHQNYFDLNCKIACYLSAEFLMGPHLGNNLVNLDIEQEALTALAELGQDLDFIMACDEEPGLGNGGLGRLAACYLDSLATLQRPAIKVILQTFHPENQVIQSTAGHDVNGFYQYELEQRRRLGYPPFSRLVRLEYPHHDPVLAEQESRKLAARLQPFLSTDHWKRITAIGPVPCFLSKIGRLYRLQIILRGPDPARLLREKPVDAWLKDWRVEVDPISLL